MQFFLRSSSRGCVAQLLEGAVAAQCFGRGFPSPGGMCWVLVPEPTRLALAHGVRLWPSVTICSALRWPAPHMDVATRSVHPIARLTIPPCCEQGWHWPGAACVAPGSLDLPLEALLIVMTQLEAWPAATPPWLVMAQPVASPWLSLGTRDSCRVVTAPGVHPHGCNPVHPKISERVGESEWF